MQLIIVECQDVHVFASGNPSTVNVHLGVMNLATFFEHKEVIEYVAKNFWPNDIFSQQQLKDAIIKTPPLRSE